MEQLTESNPFTPSTAESKKPKRGRAKKSAAADENTKVLRVPAAKTTVTSTRWARHVYQIYKELIPSHLELDPVIDAYNAFVDCLASHDDVLETYIPTKSQRYNQGLLCEKLTFERYMDGTIPGYFKNENEVWRQPALKEQHRRIVEDIKASYKVLYDLVKADLVPALQKKEHDERVKKWVPRIRKNIEDVERAIEDEKKRHEHWLVRENENHELRMQDYQRMLQDNIAELAKLLGSTRSCSHCHAVEEECACVMVEVATGKRVEREE